MAAREDLARNLAEQFAEVPGVVAVALGGSTVCGSADAESDIDCYVYTPEPLSLDLRRQIAAHLSGSVEAEIGNEFWEPGDEWCDQSSRISVDVMYRQPVWLEDQLERLLVHHEACLGYSTCLWHNVYTSSCLFDRDTWYHRMQEWSHQPYPEPLRHAVIAKNHPILRRMHSSYRHQLDLAIHRTDLVSVQHRVTSLLASYFDILFALNRLPHPGEKRLMTAARQYCSRLPAQMNQDIQQLLLASALPEQWPSLLPTMDTLLDHLDALLEAEGLLGL